MPGLKRPANRFIRVPLSDLVWPAWKIVLALAGILDLYTCGPLFLEGWNEEALDFGVSERYNLEQRTKHGTNDASQEDVADKETCQEFSFFHWGGAFFWRNIGVFFFAACIVEAMYRASEARQLALENEALDNFERKLARLYTSTRCSIMRHHQSPDLNDGDTNLARKTLRIWTPVMSVLSLWIVLLPWADVFYGRYFTCGKDASLATQWITYSLDNVHGTITQLQARLIHLLWQLLLPLQLYFRPKQFYRRLRQVVRWIRYLRFAGPLIRILFKLNDQFLVFLRVRSQKLLVQVEKAKRLASRSLLFDDIKRIESLAKVQTALAKVPSQLLHLAQKQAPGAEERLSKRKEEGKILQKKLTRLKQLASSASSERRSTSEVYERVVDLAQEMKNTIGETIFNKHLISPQTRFSVGWRVIVTCALLTELCRLYVSYRLSKTFDITLTDMVRSMLSDCDELMTKEFHRMSVQNGTLRVLARNILHLPLRASPLSAECFASNPFSRMLLSLGQLGEYTIDVVCFLDIFVWFFTGELNQNGVVVPKPFFARCILPGTLIQVLDHPTLPDRLPRLIKCFMNASQLVGYSRVIRWGLAIAPAIDMLLVEPVRVFLFRPMEDDEWFRYTESLAIFPAISGADIRNAFQSNTNLARLKRKSFGSSLQKNHLERSASGMMFQLDASPSGSVRQVVHWKDGNDHSVREPQDRESILEESGNFGYGFVVY